MAASPRMPPRTLGWQSPTPVPWRSPTWSSSLADCSSSSPARCWRVELASHSLVPPFTPPWGMAAMPTSRPAPMGAFPSRCCLARVGCVCSVQGTSRSPARSQCRPTPAVSSCASIRAPAAIVMKPWSRPNPGPSRRCPFARRSWSTPRARSGIPSGSSSPCRVWCRPPGRCPSTPFAAPTRATQASSSTACAPPRYSTSRSALRCCTRSSSMSCSSFPAVIPSSMAAMSPASWRRRPRPRRRIACTSRSISGYSTLAASWPCPGTTARAPSRWRAATRTPGFCSRPFPTPTRSTTGTISCAPTTPSARAS
jgi:hypothetical protein